MVYFLFAVLHPFKYTFNRFRLAKAEASILSDFRSDDEENTLRKKEAIALFSSLQPSNVLHPLRRPAFKEIVDRHMGDGIMSLSETSSLNDDGEVSESSYGSSMIDMNINGGTGAMGPTTRSSLLAEWQQFCIAQVMSSKYESRVSIPIYGKSGIDDSRRGGKLVRMPGILEEDGTRKASSYLELTTEKMHPRRRKKLG